MNDHDDEDTWTGSLIPGVLTDAIRQAEDDAGAALAQLDDGPSITECAKADRKWDLEKAGE